MSCFKRDKKEDKTCFEILKRAKKEFYISDNCGITQEVAQFDEQDREANQIQNNTPTPNTSTHLIASYQATLTSFGANRIKEGRPLEKLFWVAAIFLTVSFCSYQIYKNSVRYFAYRIKIDSQDSERAERSLPVITICLRSTILNNFNCYNSESLWYNKTCNETDSKGNTMRYYEMDKKRWEKGENLGRDCHVLNKNGTISISTDSEYKKVEVSSPSSYHLSKDELYVLFQSPYEFAHRKEATYVSQNRKYLRFTKGIYKIHIREKHVSRLPYPYTSNCENVNLVSNLFSDRYTFKSCQEECTFNTMMKECKDVIDAWRGYRTVDVKPFQNSKYANRKECLRTVIEDMKFNAVSLCACKKECEETIYTVVTEKISDTNDNSAWTLKLYNVGAVIKDNLYPDFPDEQYLGTFGGVLGLGGKFQVIFQLFVFVILGFAQLFARHRRA